MTKLQINIKIKKIFIFATMNKRELYESIMKNIAVHVKKAVNETAEEPEYDIVKEMSNWEIDFSDWAAKHVNRTGLFLTLEMIVEDKLDEDYIKEWIEGVMTFMAKKEGYNRTIDEIFIDHMADFVKNEFAKEFVEKVRKNLQHGDALDADL